MVALDWAPRLRSRRQRRDHLRVDMVVSMNNLSLGAENPTNRGGFSPPRRRGDEGLHTGHHFGHVFMQS